MAALLLGHATVTRCRRGPYLAGPPPERLLGVARERPEAHAGNRDRDVERDRLAGEPGADRHIGRATFAVALERITRDARAQEQEVVEVRHMPLGAEAPNVIDPLTRRALDLRDHVAVKCRGLA